ncbi:hypothetical protein BJ741DRAFT_600611 [Chytriomyces cf. hyalinus JEL632]|nr:hypothetical protein BJ741DRAFT_600611 [Chytriomyces cf. hyalinus JEL632]
MPKYSLRCTRCTAQHKQCDANQDGCTRCAQSQSKCTYSPSKPVRISCRRCATLHKRCDHAETCGRCEKAGVLCVYSETPARSANVQSPAVIRRTATSSPAAGRCHSPSSPDLDSLASTPEFDFSSGSNSSMMPVDGFNFLSDASHSTSVDVLLGSLSPLQQQTTSNLNIAPPPPSYVSQSCILTKPSNISILPSFAEWGLVHAYLHSTDPAAQSSTAFCILDRSNFIDTFFNQPPALWWIVCAFSAFYSRKQGSINSAMEYFNRAKQVALGDLHDFPQTSAFKTAQATLLISQFARILNDSLVADMFSKYAVDVFLRMDLTVATVFSPTLLEERKRTFEIILAQART